MWRKNRDNRRTDKSLEEACRRALCASWHGLEYRPRAASNRASGYAGLALAVLKEGLECYMKYAGVSAGREHALFRETRRWIEEKEGAGPFSFDNCCAQSGLDAGYIRKQLREWEKRQQYWKGFSPLAVVSAPPPKIVLGLVARAFMEREEDIVRLKARYSVRVARITAVFLLRQDCRCAFREIMRYLHYSDTALVCSAYQRAAVAIAHHRFLQRKLRKIRAAY